MNTIPHIAKPMIGWHWSTTLCADHDMPATTCDRCSEDES